MSKKVMKLIDPYTGEMQCKMCGATHFASLQSGYMRRDGVTRYYRGSWQCQNGCKLPETTTRIKFLQKLLRHQLAALRTQAKYEKLRVSEEWNELPEETKKSLDEMSGGIWLTGNESKELESKMKTLERKIARGEI